MRAVDRRQQRHRWAAFPLAVIKKFGDDQAGNLAALLAYYAFFALFPLLLVLVSVLGILLRGNAALQQRVLHSALADFPIIGNQLQSNVHSLNRTGLGLVVGLAGLFFGARGVASAAQQAFNTVWHVPYARRPGFPWNLLRSLGLLVVVGAGVIATATLSGFGGGTGAVGLGLRIVALVGSGLLNVGLFLFALRLATAAEVPTRALAFGAAIAGVSWQALLGVGGFVVAHQLRHASQVYGLFAVVIGLLTWLHLQPRSPCTRSRSTRCGLSDSGRAVWSNRR